MSLKYAAVALCFAAGISHAAVGVFGFWKLGENDPGAVAGNLAGAVTIDATGGPALSLVGSPAPTFSLNVARNSTLAMSFSGASNWSGPAVGTGTDNFAFEIWAYPTGSGGNRVLIHNGNTGTSGYGIFQNGSNWALLYGGVVAQSVAPVTLNQYADLALVRSNGSTTFYVNGTAFPVAAAAPNPPVGNLLIGANQVGTERFVGFMDEGRLTTFVAPFDPSTLFINQPVAGGGSAQSVSAMGTVAMTVSILCMACLGFYALRRRFAE